MKAPNLFTILYRNLNMSTVSLVLSLAVLFFSTIRAQDHSNPSGERPQMVLQVGHRSFIYHVGISSDGRKAASISQDGTLKIWDAQTGDLLDTFAVPPNLNIGLQSDGMTISTDGQTIEFFKTYPGEAGKTTPLFQYKTGSGEFRQFSHDTTKSYCPDLTQVVALSVDGGKSICTQISDSTGWSDDAEFVLWDKQTGRKTTIALKKQWRDGPDFEFSWDGRSLAISSGNEEEGVVIWDTINRNSRRFDGRTFKGFSPDSRTLLLVKQNEAEAAATLELRDARIGAIKQTLTGNLPDFLPPIYSPDGRLMALATESNLSNKFDSAEIILNDLQAGKIIGRLPSGPISIEKIAFSQDGATLTTLNWRGVAKLWDTRTGDLRSTLRLGDQRPKKVAFNSDAQVVVIGDDFGGVAILNFRTSQNIRTVVFPQHVAHPSFFADDKTIIHAEPGLPAMVWDLHDLEASIYGQEDSGKKNENAYKVSSPNGTVIVRLNSDGKSATLYETKTGKTLSTLVGHSGAISSVLFAPDGLSVATVSGLPPSNNASKSLLAIAAGFAGDKKSDLDAEVGKLIGDRTIRVWDARSGALMQTLQCDSVIHEARFLPDGSTIIGMHSSVTKIEKLLSGPNSYTLWDVQTGTAIKSVSAGDAGAYRLSPDGSLAIVSSREKLQALDVRTGALLWEASDVELDPFKDPFSPEGKYVLAETKYIDPNSAIKLLDLQTGRVRWSFPERGFTSFSPDGQTLVCYSSHKASFLDVGTGQIRWSIQTAETHHLAGPLLPDGRLVATFRRHYAIELRDVKDGRLLASLLILPGVGRPNDKGETTPEWIAFTPEGYYTASPGAARYIRWREGDKLLPADANAGEFNRPDLVQKAVRIR